MVRALQLLAVGKLLEGSGLQINKYSWTDLSVTPGGRTLEPKRSQSAGTQTEAVFKTCPLASVNRNVPAG